MRKLDSDKEKEADSNAAVWSNGPGHYRID